MLKCLFGHKPDFDRLLKNDGKSTICKVCGKVINEKHILRKYDSEYSKFLLDKIFMNLKDNE